MQRHRIPVGQARTLVFLVLAVFAAGPARALQIPPDMRAWVPNPALDFVDSQATITITGTVSCAWGKVGQCTEFTQPAMVEVAYQAPLGITATQGWTIEGWAKQTQDIAGDRKMVGDGDGLYLAASSNGWHLHYGTGGGPLTTFEFPLDQWTHFAVVNTDDDGMDGGAGTIDYYIDGGLLDSRALDPLGYVAFVSNTLQLGEAGPFWFPGGLDEVSLYSRPLAPSEIHALHQSGKLQPFPVPVIQASPFFWKFGTPVSFDGRHSSNATFHEWSLERLFPPQDLLMTFDCTSTGTLTLGVLTPGFYRVSLSTSNDMVSAATSRTFFVGRRGHRRR